MKVGAHILINEILTGTKNQGLYREKVDRYIPLIFAHKTITKMLMITPLRRSMDLTMLTYFGGAERTADGYAEIVREADPKLKVVSVSGVKGTPSSIIDVVWDDAQ